MADKYVKVKTLAEQEAEDQFEDDIFEDDYEEEAEVKKDNKFIGFVKKHWKKIVGGAVLAGSFIGGIAVGEHIEANRSYGDDDGCYLPDNLDDSEIDDEDITPDMVEAIDEA